MKRSEIYSGSKNHCDAFTLMETLVSIALILVMGYCVWIALSASTRANLKSLGAIRTTNTILQTDRFIREAADSLHVPYWLNPDESIAELKNALWRSKSGKYIKAINTLYDTQGLPRGITVDYTIGTKDIKTTALFPFLQVREVKR